MESQNWRERDSWIPGLLLASQSILLAKFWVWRDFIEKNIKNKTTNTKVELWSKTETT